MDKIIEQLSNCTTQELRNIANVINQEVMRRDREAEKTALLNFEKAFKKYAEINPDFCLCVECEECGSYDIDGQEVLEQFFADRKRFML
jgi:hypothetical protein